MNVSKEEFVERYKICVGLNDCETDCQKFDTEKYMTVIEYVCKNNNIAYSIETMRGGYAYENGGFARENSLGITLIGATKEVVNDLAAELCAMFNQESVLIFHDRVSAYFLTEKLI